jgi:hypothetical protein
MDRDERSQTINEPLDIVMQADEPAIQQMATPFSPSY